MRDWLRGKKTYLIAIAMLAYAALGVVIGEMSTSEAFQWVMSSGALAALRAGLKNETSGTLQGP